MTSRTEHWVGHPCHTDKGGEEKNYHHTDAVMIISLEVILARIITETARAIPVVYTALLKDDFHHNPATIEYPFTNDQIMNTS